eukprot:10547792-Ditylum_brightwellii.AAC.1
MGCELCTGREQRKPRRDSVRCVSVPEHALREGACRAGRGHAAYHIPLVGVGLVVRVQGGA